MKSIRIVGVPEHFNLPWQIAIENGSFMMDGIDLLWKDVPEGTGKMCQMLRNKETDIAIVLTEGILKDITIGNESTIVQVYVESPLLWGIHVSANSDYNSISDLQDKKIAISRLGSGSHLMSIINAKNQQWSIENLQFEVVNTIEGAIEALTTGKADYFMWEHFMTKPLVDNGIFRRVGDCPTPWPCFVIAIRNDFLKNNEKILETLLKTINMTTMGFKEIPMIDSKLATRYNQRIVDIQEWLKRTNWSQKSLEKNTFVSVQNRLFDLKIIDKKIEYSKLIKSLY